LEYLRMISYTIVARRAHNPENYHVFGFPRIMSYTVVALAREFGKIVYVATEAQLYQTRHDPHPYYPCWTDAPCLYTYDILHYRPSTASVMPKTWNISGLLARRGTIV
jgi:hypothetical protein